MGLNSTPRTWVSGETVTDTFMNTEVRDALTGIQAAWTAYTPVVAGYSSVAYTTQAGAYRRIGSTIQFWMAWQWSSINTATGGTVTISLPVVAVSTWPGQGLGHIGTAEYRTNAGVFVCGLLEITTATTASILMATPGGSVPNLTRVTNANPVSQTAGDRWFVTGTYEAA